MSKKSNYINMGAESIMRTIEGNYYAGIKIDDMTYITSDTDIIKCYNFLCETKEVHCENKITREYPFFIYQNGDIKLTIKKGMFYKIDISPAGINFRLVTDCEEDCLKILEMMASRSSRSMMDLYRSLSAKYIYNILKNDEELKHRGCIDREIKIRQIVNTI